MNLAFRHQNRTRNGSNVALYSAALDDAVKVVIRRRWLKTNLCMTGGGNPLKVLKLENEFNLILIQLGL